MCVVWKPSVSKAGLHRYSKPILSYPGADMEMIGGQLSAGGG